VLSVALKNGFTLQEQEVRFSDVIESDAAFITSTSSKIIPVHAIDGQSIPAASDALGKLMEHFEEFLSKCKGELT
ncbi:hypothetical protein HY414_00735, partial [Candidatus Kaiserbacteria bacterium]|nr:hypothetical protein [Candidatus Kaiserbacteria bacterium]